VAGGAEASTISPPAGFVARLRELYEGESPGASRFRYGLLVFDVATILYIIATSFSERFALLRTVDFLLGLVVLADFCARFVISRERWRDLTRLSTWADVGAIVSFLVPIIAQDAGFLRVLRTLRLLRTYQLLTRLRTDSGFFRANEEVIFAIVNLGVFIFVMTGLVFATQHGRNPAIGNYLDALYFTVTSLTTTGFGDITLPGATGRLLSVIIMIAGVTLFLRLAQVLFRPNKVRFDCPTCGLQRHEPDAVHCKACGIVLKIPDEGT
jgi:voltage-gated potassium channel